jgi:starch synthase
MRILFAASEVHPLAKTGGLGDVAGALPKALSDLGHEVAVVLPLYPRVRRRLRDPVVTAERVPCRFARENRPFRLLATRFEDRPGVPIHLIENPWVFEAEEAFYGSEPGSYGDGHLRFLYFSRAVCELPAALGWSPDIVHLHDWQTALVAPLIRTVHRHEDAWKDAACVLTIHNLAYQGVFPPGDLHHAGLPSFLLAEGRLLEKGLGNLLAGGIRFSDAITTVSRSYAEEILTPENGCGLDGLLRWRRELLTGIVNGLDTEVWDPSRDPHLPAHYEASDLSGKAVCRERLLQAAGLLPTGGPIFGVVSRLVGQKGLELVVPVMADLLAREPAVRFVILGSGDPGLERDFAGLSARFPGRAAARLAFDAPFSSLVEAGSDFFLMPSLFEPCGLNQLISMRYGTPPIVRRTGGLRDTVTDATAEMIAAGRATGFVFDAYSRSALAEAVARALRVFADPSALQRIREAGMRTDWSWARAAGEYERVYAEARVRATGRLHLREVLSGLPPEPLEVALPELEAIPPGYARDALVAIPFDPETLYCQWEVGGEISGPLLAALAPGEAAGMRFLLRLADSGSGELLELELPGPAHHCFARVRPGRSYEVSLLLAIPGRPSLLLHRHPAVEVPPDVRPEWQ